MYNIIKQSVPNVNIVNAIFMGFLFYILFFGFFACVLYTIIAIQGLTRNAIIFFLALYMDILTTHSIGNLKKHSSNILS